MENHVKLNYYLCGMGLEGTGETGIKHVRQKKKMGTQHANLFPSWFIG